MVWEFGAYRDVSEDALAPTQSHVEEKLPPFSLHKASGIHSTLVLECFSQMQREGWLGRSSVSLFSPGTAFLSPGEAFTLTEILLVDLDLIWGPKSCREITELPTNRCRFWYPPLISWAMGAHARTAKR